MHHCVGSNMFNENGVQHGVRPGGTLLRNHWKMLNVDTQKKQSWENFYGQWLYCVNALGWLEKLQAIAK